MSSILCQTAKFSRFEHEIKQSLIHFNSAKYLLILSIVSGRSIFLDTKCFHCQNSFTDDCCRFKRTCQILTLCCWDLPTAIQDLRNFDLHEPTNKNEIKIHSKAIQENALTSLSLVYIAVFSLLGFASFLSLFFESVDLKIRRFQVLGNFSATELKRLILVTCDF